VSSTVDDTRGIVLSSPDAVNRRPRYSRLVPRWIDHIDTGPRDDALYALEHADDPLLVLRALADLYEWRRATTDLAVIDARKAGASWEDIAQALRRSRQSVHRQWSDVDVGAE
jgi:hypothetical protein